MQDDIVVRNVVYLPELGINEGILCWLGLEEVFQFAGRYQLC